MNRNGNLANINGDSGARPRKGNPRVRARGVEDPVGHNFPYSFDDAILNTVPTTQANGSLKYQLPGTINKTDGVFELVVDARTNTIYHRQFKGN